MYKIDKTNEIKLIPGNYKLSISIVSSVELFLYLNFLKLKNEFLSICKESFFFHFMTLKTLKVKNTGFYAYAIIRQKLANHSIFPVQSITKKSFDRLKFLLKFLCFENPCPRKAGCNKKGESSKKTS